MSVWHNTRPEDIENSKITYSEVNTVLQEEAGYKREAPLIIPALLRGFDCVYRRHQAQSKANPLWSRILDQEDRPVAHPAARIPNTIQKTNEKHTQA